MVRLVVLILIFFITVAGCFFAYDLLGIPVTVCLIIVLLTISYFGIYLKKGLDSELAYWGLAYGAFSILFLGIGLIQSHAGCPNLTGDCYHPGLPAGLFGYKRIIGSFLVCTNGLAIAAILNNIRKLLASSNDNHEIIFK